LRIWTIVFAPSIDRTWQNLSIVLLQFWYGFTGFMQSMWSVISLVLE